MGQRVAFALHRQLHLQIFLSLVGAAQPTGCGEEAGGAGRRAAPPDDTSPEAVDGGGDGGGGGGDSVADGGEPDGVVPLLDATADLAAADAEGSALLDGGPIEQTDAAPDALPADAALATDGSGTPDQGQPPPGPSLFVDGCPVPGRALARRIDRPDLRMEGPDAVGGEGDWLLIGERAAFIVAGTELSRTYWHTGGILVDAVALSGCAQAGPEQFSEVVPLFGRLDLNDLVGRSVLRGFFGERVELLADGADGGSATVRVHGRDDRFWLIELLVLAEAYGAGRFRSLSAPLGIETWVDYVLEPGSAVLRIEVSTRNAGAAPLQLLTAMALWFGDTVPESHFAASSLTVSGYTLELGIPWLAASRGDGAWAFAAPGANPAAVREVGTLGVVDANAVFLPPTLGPRGGEDTHVAVFLLAVGPGDANSAARLLGPLNPEPTPHRRYTLFPVAGRTVDEPSGAALAGATIELQLQDASGTWRTLDSFRSGVDGRFQGEIPDFGHPRPEYRLVAHLAGRPDPAPLGFRVPEVPELTLAFPAGGRLAYDVRDEAGRGLPAKILLWQGEHLVQRIYSIAGLGEEPVPPGEYTVSVSRGFEHSPYQGALTVQPQQQAELSVVLPRLVDTSGFLSVDTHLHASPSPDSMVAIPQRIATVAAEGLEVAVSTDHEAVADWSWGVRETGLGSWVATVIGQEITASLPNHLNAFPLVPLAPPAARDMRGGYVHWFGLDMAQIQAAARERGASLITLNHPRSGRCGYLCLARWDRLTGSSLLDDPSRLGFAPDAAFWAEDFDAIELMNGPQRVLLDPAAPEQSGLLDDWLSLLNHGARITALGASDTHGLDAPGMPRTYFAASSDEPAGFDEQELVDSLRAGRALVSSGAFARVLVDGVAGLGDTITVDDGEVELYLRIEALPEVDVTRFLVLANCDEVLELPTAA
ncbi:MAG: carboxypeptidase regulatory-like domain-containing protein, partial [Deltaproteobacteria bacterium]|nr:carboxypeptidase regulatory-like domain-containing protein [Deltaproteobacteria bacterium]